MSDVLSRAPEDRRRVIVQLLLQPRAWRAVRSAIEDQCERDGTPKPRGILEVIQYLIENWETWYPILVAILAMFGIILPPIPTP